LCLSIVAKAANAKEIDGVGEKVKTPIARETWVFKLFALVLNIAVRCSQFKDNEGKTKLYFLTIHENS